MPRPPETFTFTWRDVTCRVEHTRDWRNEGWSRLIIRVVSPRGAPLPFAESGYLDHQLDEDTLIACGGAVRYVTAWLEHDAAFPRYALALYRWKQSDLFR